MRVTREKAADNRERIVETAAEARLRPVYGCNSANRAMRTMTIQAADIS